MKILRLSTLSLTLAIAVFAFGYANPAFAGKKCDADDTHPSCKDDGGGGGGITYTAELKGAFVFGPLPFTVDVQENTLRHDAAIKIIRPLFDSKPMEQATWDNVFSMPDNDGDPCNLFGSIGTVDEFTAPTKGKGVKGWWIVKSGGVGIRFRKIPLLTNSDDPVDVSLDLIGNCIYSGGTDSCQPFLPDPNTNSGISEIPLLNFLIHAKAAKGTPAIDGCHDGGGLLLSKSTLVIKATAN